MPLSDPHDGVAALIDVLAFHVEAGVDVALDEMPANRFAESAAELGRTSKPLERKGNQETRLSEPPRTVPSPRPAAPRAAPAGLAAPPLPGAPPPPDVAAMAAREAAASAGTLEELRSLLAAFDGCPLRFTATQLVFADGNPLAKLMFVGEAPGRDEDIEGLPFVGRSGKLLDRMMAAIGIDRTRAYIANVVPWRPPGNRTPTPQETAICLPFIRRQIELVDPDVLVCLGGPSAQTLLNVKDGITKARGRWLEYDTGRRKIAALATFHPAYLLRNPIGKRLAWRDFLAIRAALDGRG